MITLLDGDVADEPGGFDWAVPDEGGALPTELAAHEGDKYSVKETAP